MTLPALPLPPLERRFIHLSLVAIPPLVLALGLARGGRSALATLLTSALVTADFLWLARGLRAAASPGRSVPSGAGPRAAVATLGRSLLLLLGLYGILTLLPGEGLAAALGVGLPLALLAAAGVPEPRS
jgi:hypothetical protein